MDTVHVAIAPQVPSCHGFEAKFQTLHFAVACIRPRIKSKNHAQSSLTAHANQMPFHKNTEKEPSAAATPANMDRYLRMTTA